MNEQGWLHRLNRKVLKTCSICHDQCQSATLELIASARQTYATSRKALIIDYIRTGEADWTSAGISAIYAALNSGIQHSFCVHKGDPDGWPDETEFIRTARAHIVSSGLAPDYVCRAKDTWNQCGNPFGLVDSHEGRSNKSRKGPVLYLDAVSRAWTPHFVQHINQMNSARLGSMGFVTMGSSGFECFDLGLWSEAKSSLENVSEILFNADEIVCDSPETVWMLRKGTKELGGPLFPSAMNYVDWLDDLFRDSRDQLAPSATSKHLHGKAVTYHDPSYLGRYGDGNYDAPRRLAVDVLGCDLREMRYYREESMPTGPYFGYISNQLADEIADFRLRQARMVEAEAILTASPYDFHNLTRQLNADLEVLYLPSLIDIR